MARNTRSRSNSFRSKSFDETSSTTTTTPSKRKDSVSKQNDYSDSSASAEAKELLQILQQLHRNGRNLLHHATTQPNLIPLAHLLLQRLHQVSHDDANGNVENNNNNNNNKTLLTEFLSQPDLENGYTPLHWSIRNANLGALLLLLRHSHQPQQSRFLTRPMQLLQQNHHNNNQRDHEGWTPSQLLSQLQIKTLQACRKHIQRPQVVALASSSRPTRSRSNSFLQDEPQLLEQEQEEEPLGDNELGLLQSRANLLQPVQDSTTTTTTTTSSSVARQPFGCEVLTFGSANHCALGVVGGGGGGTATSVTKHRPQRLAAFGLADSSGAVQVAAAPHHTIVLTAEGQVYTLGLGKGGRLGVGHEQSLPQPTLLGALSKRRVVHVAAAENHSLCCTGDGHVYAWGSNRFGQVSYQHSVVIQTTPRRVDELRGQHCLSVAAGDKHSVALTRTGHVYSWGDNAQGQLGRRRRSSTNNRFGTVERIVDALSTKTVSAIAASEHSTLALTLPAAGAIHHAVYAWGHGNPVPTKVTFLQDTNHHVVDPVSICCAKHHNAVVTSDGRVYTWGLHAETLGSSSSTTKNETSSSSSAWLGLTVAKPVELPEKAIQVSAHDHHTAVVTQEGHLYTWGATIPTNVMGHEGVRYQPSPKRVEGVHRAVQVAVAKEHTVFLMGTAFPALDDDYDSPPDNVVLSLEHLAARQVMKHVDLFNVLPVSILAERNQSWWLQQYCQRFIQLNLDGVLLLGRKSDLNQYLENCLSAPTPRLDPDDTLVHPLVTQVLLPHSDKAEWLAACRGILENLAISTRVRYQRRLSLNGRRGGQRRRALSFHDQKEQDAAKEDEEEDGPLQAGVQGCSKRCLMLTSGLDRLESSTEIVARHDCLSKELRGIRKRLGQIAKLEQKTGVLLTSDERGKVARKPLLEADQVPLENALTKLKRVMEQRNLVQEDNHAKKKKEEMDSPKKVQFAENPEKTSDEPRLVGEFYCTVCNVQCPDAHSLALHQNGRKHRNRILQCAQDEEKRTAASLEKNKPKTPQPIQQQRPLNPWKTDPVQPKYKLAPPPHKPGPCPSPATPTKRFWCPDTTKPTNNKVDDFRSILAEQEQKQSKTVLTPRVTRPPQGWLLQPGSMAPPPLKSPPWATSPMARVPVHNVKVVALDEKGPSNTKPSLGEFLLGPPKPSPKTLSSTAAPWALPTAKISNDPSSFPAVAANAAASLKEIQKQEEALRSRCSDNIAKDPKWYIRHAERAGSFSAIVEEAAREREMQRIVEEQRQIEAEIQSQRQAQEQTTQTTRKGTNNRPPKKNKKKKKKKNTNNEPRNRKPDKSQNTEKSSQGKQKTSGPRRGGAKAATAATSENVNC